MHVTVRYGVVYRGFVIWPDLNTTQLLDYVIKTRLTVLDIRKIKYYELFLLNLYNNLIITVNREYFMSKIFHVIIFRVK